MADEHGVLDPFPAVPMMMDSVVEEFGVEGVLIILSRELAGSVRKTDVFAKQEIDALLITLTNKAVLENEEVTAEKKQRWLSHYGFQD